MKNQASRIRLLVVDDHPVVREGLGAMLAGWPEIELVGLLTTGAEALAESERSRPDVMLLDLRLPDMSGLEVLRRLEERGAGPRVLAFTTFDQPEDVYQALRLGARGYVLKVAPREELREAIAAAQAGRRYLPPGVAERLAERLPMTPLTPRECDVLELIVRGQTNRDIARELALTAGTVKGYVHAVYGKLGVQHRAQAVAEAVRRGLVRMGRHRARSAARDL